MQLADLKIIYTWFSTLMTTKKKIISFNKARMEQWGNTPTRPLIHHLCINPKSEHLRRRIKINYSVSLVDEKHLFEWFYTYVIYTEYNEWSKSQPIYKK